MTNHAVLSGIEQREKNRQKNLANKPQKPAKVPKNWQSGS